MYHNINDARMRLQGSIVRYLGEPVVVEEIDPDMSVFLRRLEDGLVTRHGPKEGEEVASVLEALDTRPVPLGFVNITPNCAVHVSRKPCRRWKQGLVRENALVMNITRSTYPSSQIFRSSALVKTIRGKYPSYTDCLREVLASDRTISQAFGRNWALSKTVNDGSEELPRHLRGLGEYVVHVNERITQEVHDNIEEWRQRLREARAEWRKSNTSVPSSAELRYRTYHVGKVDEMGNMVINPKYEYLQEDFEENSND